MLHVTMLCCGHTGCPCGGMGVQVRPEHQSPRTVHTTQSPACQTRRDRCCCGVGVVEVDVVVQEELDTAEQT